MTTKVPSIPNLTDDNVQQVLSAAKEILEVREGWRGDPLDKNVTFRDLEALKLVEETANADTIVSSLPVQVLPVVNPSVFAPDDYDESSDLSTPPAPENLEATGGYSTIYLSWSYPPYKNHAYTEIYRSFADDLTTATLIGSTPGNVYSDPVGTEINAYYWVRNVSQGNVQSPYNSSGGTLAGTAVDVARAIERVSNEIESLPLYTDLANSIASLEGATNSVVNQVAEIEANSAALTNTIIAVDSQSKVGIEIQAKAVAGLGGQYSVKIDANGHVAGFGLSNTLVNSTPTSAFIIRADKFAIVDPASTGDNLTNTPSADSIPFVVSGGNTYIKAAFIQDATITNAKIANVAADKITAGTITAAIDLQAPKVRSGNVAYGQAGFFLGSDGGTNKFYIGNGSTGVSGRELSFNGTDVTVRGTIYAYAGNISNVTANQITIYDNAGGVLLASGSGVRATDLLNSSVTLSTLGAGAFAYLSQFNTGNITSYIASGAIGNALIGSAAIDTANIRSLAVKTAQIDNLAVTSAKIGNAEVQTLKIAGNAVTVPSVTSSGDGQEITYSEISFLNMYITITQPGWIFASVTGVVDYPQGEVNGEHQLYINGTRVARTHSGSGYMTSMSMSGATYLSSAGTYLVNYTAYKTDESGNGWRYTVVSDRTLYAQGVMR